MTNHFTISKGSYQKPKALCPWKTSSDSSYFANVDGTKRAFDEYVDLANQNVHRAGGSFHLAFGPEGCGKSSLLNRCVAYLKSVNDKNSTIIVDVSNDIHAAIPAAQKAEEAWLIIKDELALHKPALTDQQINEINKEGTTFVSSIRRLQKYLEENGSSLVVILPQIELVQEFSSYFSLMKDGVALFAETTSSEIEQHCKHAYGSQSKTPVQIMKLSPLQVEDGRTFVSNRLSQRTEKCPEISAEAIDQMMETRISGGIGASIRELHLVCEAVYQNMLDKEKTSANYADFSEHYVKNGIVR